MEEEGENKGKERKLLFLREKKLWGRPGANLGPHRLLQTEDCAPFGGSAGLTRFLTQSVKQIYILVTTLAFPNNKPFGLSMQLIMLKKRKHITYMVIHGTLHSWFSISGKGGLWQNTRSLKTHWKKNIYIEWLRFFSFNAYIKFSIKQLELCWLHDPGVLRRNSCQKNFRMLAIAGLSVRMQIMVLWLHKSIFITSSKCNCWE